MATLTANNNGAVLYYEDTGAPDNSSIYTTIFLVHGFVFHGAVFRPAFRLAPKHNLRLVTVNMREYPGSSPLTDAEMKNWRTPEPECQRPALRDQGLEFANFMARFIETENLPAPTEVDGKTIGGVAILTWSLSNGHLMAMLSNATQLTPDAYNLLDRYLRTAFMYGPPAVVLGVAAPPGTYSPFVDPDIPDAEKPMYFRPWVSGYWTRFPDIAAITVSTVQPAKLKDMYKTTSDPKYIPTTDRMSPEVLESVTAPSVVERIGSPFDIIEEVYAENVHYGLFDTKGTWSNLRVVAFWMDMSCAYCLWGAKALADQLAQPTTEGRQRRDVKHVKLEVANHFLHWDDPERFVDVLAQYV